MLSSSTFILRLERNGFDFIPGQHVLVGLPNSIETREYSIYSGVNEAHIEILVREIKEGKVSSSLKKSEPGDYLNIQDAIGYFTIEEKLIEQKSFLFIASGTGIAPFHSFVQSYPSLDYNLIHGIRYSEEAYERYKYDLGRYVSCTSGDKKGDFHGRVTHWLKINPVNSDTLCYLCGNCDMIHDVYDILEEQGVPTHNIFTEVYF